MKNEEICPAIKAGQAGVVKLVYTPALGAGGAIRESSSLSACTKH